METFAELTQREVEVAAGGAILGSFLAVVIVGTITMTILTIIASWRIISKAGEPGWKALIPIYNVYMLFKIVGMKGWFWGLFLAGILLGVIMSVDGSSVTFTMTNEQIASFDWNGHMLTVVSILIYALFACGVEIYYSIRTSKAFGYGGLFAAGLFFFQPIFWMILGFGKSKYNKKVALK